MGNKYINFYNGNYLYSEQKSMSNSEKYLTIPVHFYDRHIFSHKGVINLQKKDKNFFVYYFDIRSSGILDNYKKRIQVAPNKNEIKDFFIPISVYDAGNKKCYVKFSSCLPIVNNSFSLKSVWIDFIYIVYCLKTNEKIKYLAKDTNSSENYWLYFSTNFNDLLFCKENEFIELTDFEKKKIIREIDKFEALKRLHSIFNDDLNNNEEKRSEIKNENFEKITQISDHEISKENDIDNDIEFLSFEEINKENGNFKNSHNENKDIGKKAENIFYSKIKNDPDFVAKNLRIEKINSVEWVNEFKESYKPYDFCINDHIFIDVKGTYDEKSYFEMSPNENAFRKDQKENGNEYFIVNITNIINDYEQQKFIFFSNEEIDNLDLKEKIKFVYKE